MQVVGVGGAASKLVHQLWETVPRQGTLDCIIIDTDPEALFSSPMPSDRKLLLGSNFQQQFMRTPSWNNILGREGVGKVRWGLPDTLHSRPWHINTADLSAG